MKHNLSFPFSVVQKESMKLIYLRANSHRFFLRSDDKILRRMSAR